MKRILSHGSSGSAASAALKTPTTNSSMALDVDNTSALADAGDERDLDAAGPPEREGKGLATPIATRMEGMQVRSPEQTEVFSRGGASTSTAHQPKFWDPNLSSKRKLPHRSYTSSTDSDISVHPYVPSQSGSMYDAEGFAKPIGSYGPRGVRTESPEAGMIPAAHAAVSAADEAIKQLNGTAATVYGGTTYSGFPPPPDNPYQLPRGFANFVRPQHRSMEPGVTRQSSMSSSTTEASTSSEEEDLTLPQVMWLPSNREKEGSPNAAAASWLYGRPQQTTQGRASRAKSPYGGRTSPQKMPPPPVHRVASPHFRPSGAGAYGFGAITPSSAPSGSALPGGLNPNAPDIDDDGTTVGAQEQPSSASSISGSSGLDLLWRAVTHDHTDDAPAPEHGDVRSPHGELPDDRPVDAKGKRKAGAEAVAQWRQSGIPLGVGEDPDRRRRESTNSTDAHVDADGEAIMSPPPHKKRRKSSAQTDLASAHVKKESRTTSFSSQGRTSGNVHVPPPTSTRARSASTDANGDAEWESEPEEDEGESEVDSEYGASARSGTGRIRRPSAKMKLAAAHAQAASGPRKPGGSRGGRGGAAKSAAGRKGSAAASTGTKKGTSAGAGTESPAPAQKVAKGVTHVPAGGVQCEYVNPLPVSYPFPVRYGAIDNIRNTLFRLRPFIAG